MTRIDAETLREWRRARGWDVPKMARQLRQASSEPIAAHEGLVRMIRAWEGGEHQLSERYELLGCAAWVLFPPRLYGGAGTLLVAWLLVPVSHGRSLGTGSER